MNKNRNTYQLASNLSNKLGRRKGMGRWPMATLAVLLLTLSACSQAESATSTSSTAVSEVSSSMIGIDSMRSSTEVANATSASEERAAQSSSQATQEALPNTLFFGQYPQATDTPEPIEWIVLDQQEDRVLLLAKDSIESLPWHKTWEGVTWDRSDVRAWLNGEFLQTAFSSEEQDGVLVTNLDNGDDLGYGTPVGEATQDKVFLLSGAEAERYLTSEANRTVKPTPYAISHGAYTNDRGNCAWWLRSPGMTETSPAYIASAGSVGNRAHEVNETIIGVRPAIWVKRDQLKTDSANEGNASEPVINAASIWDKYDQDPNKKTPTHGETETAVGYITYIGQDSHGTPSMEISDVAGGRSYVLGVFGSYEEMASVSVGDKVMISGYFHIMSADDKVVLKSCEILNAWKSE